MTTAAAPTRRERRRLEIRERILQAARSLFETRGFEATTVSAISERADIAYGTFFNHFPSKVDLLHELSDIALRDLFEGFEALSRQPGSFADHLVLLFEEAASGTEATGEPTRELLGAMMTQSFSEGAVSDDRRMRAAFRRFLLDGLASGEVRSDVDLDTLTDVVVGTWYSIFLGWVHLDGYPIRERASQAAKLLAGTLAKPA